VRAKNAVTSVPRLNVAPRDRDQPAPFVPRLRRQHDDVRGPVMPSDAAPHVSGLIAGRQRAPLADRCCHGTPPGSPGIVRNRQGPEQPEPQSPVQPSTMRATPTCDSTPDSPGRQTLRQPRQNTLCSQSWWQSACSMVPQASISSFGRFASSAFIHPAGLGTQQLRQCPRSRTEMPHGGSCSLLVCARQGGGSVGHSSLVPRSWPCAC